MSLLEDIFLQDEANEAQELERVIEGDEYDERPRSVASNSDDSSVKEDEAEEEKKRVDPAGDKPKRIVKNPRFLLNPARLTGPRGIKVIPEHFKDFKFRGKGHEKEDLDLILKKLEHWAYRLYPKFGFDDCLKKIETLGKKKPVMVHLHKIRSDQLQSEETVVQKDLSDEEDNIPSVEDDEFDKLLQQQIDLARATPAPDSVRKTAATPRHVNMSPFAMPKATSSPSISDEQRERMQRNRKLAEERRLARLKQNTINEKPAEVETMRLNTLQERLSNANEDSSDEDTSMTIINQSVTVEINATSNKEVEMAKDTDKDLTDDDMRGNRNKSKELDTEIKLTNTTNVNVELSQTYTEQQQVHEICTEQKHTETLTEQESEICLVQESETYTERQNLSKSYIEQRQQSLTYTEQQNLSETYTEKQDMEVGTEDLDEQNRETHNTNYVKKDTDGITVPHCKETTNISNITSDIEVLENVEENCLDGTESENAGGIKEGKMTEIVTEDRIETIKNKRSRSVSIEKEQILNISTEVNEAKIVQDASQIDKMVEEDIMDVDFDDDF